MDVAFIHPSLKNAACKKKGKNVATAIDPFRNLLLYLVPRKYSGTVGGMLSCIHDRGSSILSPTTTQEAYWEDESEGRLVLKLR